jgi:hypothetical protein
MPAMMSLNRINVRPGDPAFAIGTNLCEWFELGRKTGTDYWLEGDIVGTPPEFIFNGRIYMPGSSASGTVIDNFPKGPVPTGWIKRQRISANGYDLVDTNDKILFGYEVLENDICHVTVNIYTSDGTLVAETLADRFLLHRSPAKIGRGGIVLS